ncbi:MAG: bifunctional pyr operon transcriptional regulator/uracil phosphoribosyltransferase PyrR [Phycisphaerae bacterium]
MTVILNAKQINKTIGVIAERIIADLPPDSQIAAVGIRSRGEILAQRLAAKLEELSGREIPCGTLDITLYRDDLNSPANTQAKVQPTEIGFNIDDCIIILVDDVLYTGRSTRAALDALVDLGRPMAIKLAVLVERSGRELPIQADYIGFKAEVDVDKRVQVNFVESDGKDEVFVE